MKQFNWKTNTFKFCQNDRIIFIYDGKKYSGMIAERVKENNVEQFLVLFDSIDNPYQHNPVWMFGAALQRERAENNV